MTENVVEGGTSDIIILMLSTSSTWKSFRLIYRDCRTIQFSRVTSLSPYDEDDFPA